MGKRDKKDKKKKRKKDKERKHKREKKHVEEVAELVSDEDNSGAESPSQLLLKRAKGNGSGEAEPRRKRKRSSSRSRSRSRSSTRSRSRTRSLSPQSSTCSRSSSPQKSRDRGGDEKKRVESLRKRVYQRDPKENGSSASGGSKKKRRNRNRFYNDNNTGKRGKFDRSRKVWGLDDDINAGGRSRSVSSERRHRRERNRSGSSECSRSPNGRKPGYLDDVRDENGRIDKKKVLEIARRNASLGQLDSLLTAGALAPEIAKLKSQNADNVFNYVQKLREIPDEGPPPSTSAPAPQVEPTPVSSDEEEKEERFKRMTEKRRAAMKHHDDEEMPIVARKPFEVKKPLLGLSGIKINIANANALPTKTAQERIQEEAKLRAAQAPAAPTNPYQDWVPVVKEKEQQAAKRKEKEAAPVISDVFGAAFLPPPPMPPPIDMLLPPPPVPPSFDFGGIPPVADPAPFLPPPPLPPSEI
uniref:Protein SON n=1 Tax=Steinernema glaseri TaxID=37863 RepID=A0A1I7ZX95_9BILA